MEFISKAAFQQMVENVAYLLALALLFDAVLRSRRSGNYKYSQVIYGILTGLIGTWIMLNPWFFTPGITFDTRSVLLSTSGLFFGSGPTLIAMLITSMVRVYQGGAGVLTGVSVIAATGLLGLLARRMLRKRLGKLAWWELYLFGIGIHLVMLALMFTFPYQTALKVLANISLPVMLIYPVGNLLLGLLLTDRLQREQTDANLRESEEKYRQIVETAREGIWSIDNFGKTIFVNAEMAQMLGRTVEEIIGKPVNDYFFAEDLEDHRQKLEQRRTGQTGRYQRRFRRKDGGECWCFVSATPILDQDGNFSGSFGMMSDITSLKLTKQSLQKSEEQYRVLTENIKDVVWILDTEDLHFRYISPSVTRLLGFTVEEMLAHSIDHTVTHSGKDDLVSQIRERSQAFQNGWAGEDIYYTDEFALPCKDGSTVWTETIMNYYLNAESGHVEARGVTRDIADRKSAEEKVQQAQLELQRLLLETERSRRRLLSVVEEQRQTEEALQKSTEELRVAYDFTLQGWSNALEMRERETAGHSQRVVELTLELARKFEIPAERMVHVQRGALLHDIGKMGIPDSILLKPGKLTDDEWAIMRQHPEFAHRLLAHIPYLAPALEIPYGHHERWDGSGYPHGLQGESIPLTARIFAVVDVWDALMHDRPYREAWQEQAVIAYLKENAGKQFDPQVVNAFFTIVNRSKDSA